MQGQEEAIPTSRQSRSEEQPSLSEGFERSLAENTLKEGIQDAQGNYLPPFTAAYATQNLQNAYNNAYKKTEQAKRLRCCIRTTRPVPVRNHVKHLIELEFQAKDGIGQEDVRLLEHVAFKMQNAAKQAIARFNGYKLSCNTFDSVDIKTGEIKQVKSQTIYVNGLSLGPKTEEE